MSQPGKPFIKSPPQTPSPVTGAAGSSVTASELTTYAVAAGMKVPAERAAFLAHACAGNTVLRDKIEQRLGAHATAPAFAALPPSVAAPAPGPSHAPASVSAPGTELQRMPEPTLTAPQNQPAAMALVPMSASQLAAITAQRSNAFPWMTATFLAVAVGVLGVLFMKEKDARQRAETAGQQAGQRADTAVQEAAAARAAAGKERDTAAQQIAAAHKQAEQLRAVADEQRQRAETATRQATLAKAEADRQRLAGEAAAKDEGGAALAKAALVEAGQEREAIRAAQKETNLALADALAKLATAQLEGSRIAEAEASARRSLELRTAQAVTGWPLVESRTLLGAVLLQKNADADAGREIDAAAGEIEVLGAPTNDADRARFTMAAKRIVQFYNATGRRKEGVDLKRKFDAMLRPQ